MTAASSLASPAASSDLRPAPGTAGTTPWGTTDWLLLGLITLLTVVGLYTGVYWHDLPAEDALMLMRYATHLAGGHGIVWNVGDAPVEGATDFLYLLVLSAWMKVSGLGAILAARLLLAFSHIACVAVLYGAARRIAGAGRVTSAVLAAYLALGLGIVHTGNGFSSPFYGLMALLAWCFAWSVVERGSTTARGAGFAAFALLTGLTRPDGVLLAVFMTAALLYLLRGASLRVVAITVGVFAVFGGAYFAWRFHYFGHLLPNPFYKKGGGHLYPSTLRFSFSSVFKMLMPLIPVFLLGLFVPVTRRLAIFSLIPVAGFTSIWILLSNENNYGMRFQYVVLPFSLLSAAALLHRLRLHFARTSLGESLSGPRFILPVWASALSVVVLLMALHLYWNTLVPGPERIGTGAYGIATGLARYQDRHYTMVVTEAGVIPYFSGWRAIDAWGLNDAEIVHNKRGLTSEYLDQNHPAVIMFHNATNYSKADYDRGWRGDPPPAQTLKYLVEVTSHYAATHGYTLAARWGEQPCETDAWYVRADLPEHDDLVRIIQQPNYFYPYSEAGHGTNFLGPNPPESCDDNKAVVTDHQ